MKPKMFAACVLSALPFLPAFGQSAPPDNTPQRTATGALIGAAGRAPERVDAPSNFAAPVSLGFTYQGRLEINNAPANGAYDLRFWLYDDAGVLVAGPICHDNVAVDQGVFTVTLDFGSQFTGDARFLEIAVRPGGAAGDCHLGGGYTTLSPRQPLTATPYALGLRLPFTGLRNNPGYLFTVQNSTGASYSAGLRGIIGIPAGFGFIDSAGVQGDSSQSFGAGVLGISDEYVGVIGYSAGDGGRGVFGRTDGINSEAVWGWATNANSKAVYGSASNSSSWAGYFDGKSYFNGNVGIGTPSPTSKLDVVGTARVTGLQLPTGAATGRVLTSDASGNGTWQALPAATNQAFFISGPGVMPTATTGFLSTTLNVTITAGQKIHVTATQTFGSTALLGGGGLDIYIGYRLVGAPAISLAGGGMWDNRVPQNTRIPFTVSAVLTGLPAGTYEVGMAGDDDGNGMWNNMEWGYVSVIVLN